MKDRRGFAALVVVLVVAGIGLPAIGYTTDPAFESTAYLAGLPAVGEGLPATLSILVDRAASLPGADGRTLLPAGTRLESVFQDQRGILRMRLAISGESVPSAPQPALAETFESLVSRALTGVDHNGIEVRVSIDGAADVPLGDLAMPAVGSAPQGAKLPGAASRLETDAGPAAAGVIAHGDGQPTGALSGVVVFVSAGHGWTASSPTWILQRPILLDMNEDYANLDQLNCFVNYLYNAGAVVVPFRPVGYQPIEIVLDNDDPGVSYAGAWSDVTDASVYYENGTTPSGVHYRTCAASATESAVARYQPTIATAGFYPVYAWTPDGTDRIEQTYRIIHSGGTAVMRIDHRRLGRGWVWLGNYHFAAGTSGAVEISNQFVGSGLTVADAIRFGNGIGDIVGAGVNTISGYPREEEGSRYWAESEAGVRAEGLPNGIWDLGSDDISENTGTAARWSREMNNQDTNNQRWRRVYVEFHTNAAGCPGPCDAKGTLALVNSSTPTTNQEAFSTIIGDKVENDLLAIDDTFEYQWAARPNPYYGGYGAISATNNGNEFDATLLEVAFHDNIQDAANLRNLKVRDAVARSTLHGLIDFLSSTTVFPDTQVAAAYPPEPPATLALRQQPGGVTVTWTPGVATPPYGQPASGYRVYRSSDGYGFGQGVDVGAVTSVTLTDLPMDQLSYVRVSAYNAGGESFPSETLAVLPGSDALPRLLVVNGYDRISRQQDYVQILPGGPIERAIPRKVNSADYIVQHVQAVPAGLATIDSASNEEVLAGTVNVNDYAALIWILGEESAADKTFDVAEQALVDAYLAAGGKLFVSGAELGYELDGQAAGTAFYEGTLRADFLGDDAGSSRVRGVDGVFGDVGEMDISPAAGAPYDAEKPDRLNSLPGAKAVLGYAGGLGGAAAVQYDSGTYRTLTLGFPFECIGAPADRAAVMSRALDFLFNGSDASRWPKWITGFEGYSPNEFVLFREPRFSSTTSANINSRNVYAGVSTEVPAAEGTLTYKVRWAFVDSSTSRWLRLVTTDTPVMPNPLIDLRRAVRLRLRMDSASVRLALGIREVGVDGMVGIDGGTTGDIEWVGASAVTGGVPQGRLITGQLGLWQTLTILPHPGNTKAFTGDGVLGSTTGKGVLEHLALASTGTSGPFALYLDGIEQPAPPKTDFDIDGDVDATDFDAFAACAEGPAMPVGDACQSRDLDSDGDVDSADFARFQVCWSGADIVADPDCLP